MPYWVREAEKEQTMANRSFTRFLGQVADTFSGPSRQNMELAYLNQAVSIYDLERRQHEVDAGKFRDF